jgi:hypothetical protein
MDHYLKTENYAPDVRIGLNEICYDDVACVNVLFTIVMKIKCGNVMRYYVFA